jgi:hypothetical protein
MLIGKESRAQFLKDCARVAGSDPRFKLISIGGEPTLRGIYDVIDQGRTLNQFKVEIRWKPGYPDMFPALFEVGGKIPRVADWHIYEGADFSCCITVRIQEHIYCLDSFSLEKFIDTHVKSYLYNQAHRMMFGYYADKEYSHDYSGPWEFYRELFDTIDDNQILAYMTHIVENDLGKNTKCYCGRKARMRRCHFAGYNIFRQVDKGLLREELMRLRTTLGAFDS